MTEIFKLNVLSANKLKTHNPLKKIKIKEMKVYAVISLNNQTAVTHTNLDEGSNPRFDYRTEFTVNHLTDLLKISLISQHSCFPNRTIGCVVIPLHDLSTNASADSFRQVSYEVKGSSGKCKGGLNLSYKFEDKINDGTNTAGTHKHAFTSLGPASAPNGVAVDYSVAHTSLHPLAPSVYPPPAYPVSHWPAYLPASPAYPWNNPPVHSSSSSSNFGTGIKTGLLAYGLLGDNVTAITDMVGGVCSDYDAGFLDGGF